jgi:hypothetical protein
MHPLHDYVAGLLSEKLKSRKVVVWYDARREFQPFLRELRSGARASNQPLSVAVAGCEAQLVEFAGSMFELRAAVEPLVSGDVVGNVVLYLPGCERNRLGSVLMELEKIGECLEWQLKRLARNVLRKRYTDGVIDELLAPERVTYEDLARASSDTGGAENPSILKSIFDDARDSESLLAAWLASDVRDAEIAEKEATRELAKLVRSQLGLELPEDAALS